MQEGCSNYSETRQRTEIGYFNNMIEVYRDWDYSKVGMLEGLLKAEGIPTFLRNQNAVTMTTEIPIPVMYPNLCVLNAEDVERANEIIQAFTNRDDSDEGPDWNCSSCGEGNGSNFSECWSCQTPRDSA